MQQIYLEECAMRRAEEEEREAMQREKEDRKDVWLREKVRLKLMSYDMS